MTTPASIRYANPGAQYPGPISQKWGSTGHEVIGGGHKIAVFPDPVRGAAAQLDLLTQNYTGKTLGDAVAKWSGGNNVDSYLGHIQRETGLRPDFVLSREAMSDPKIAIGLARAMAGHEAGRPSPLSEADWQQAFALVSGKAGGEPQAQPQAPVSGAGQAQVAAIPGGPPRAVPEAPAALTDTTKPQERVNQLFAELEREAPPQWFVPMGIPRRRA